MLQKINLVQVSLDDMSSVIRNIIAEEINKAQNFISAPPKKESDNFLSREDVCKLLKVSQTTLFHWNRNKTLTNQKLGRRVYYLESDVKEKLINPKTAA
jgi:predicted DNA-binding transcriptional regulator AlpA